MAGCRSPTGRDADALAAWIFAWRHHWPTAFLTHFGNEADQVTAWAERHVDDPGRYIKLRRIALENLAQIL